MKKFKIKIMASLLAIIILTLTFTSCQNEEKNSQANNQDSFKSYDELTNLILKK